ncbi:MAG: helix-turn-helix domain-containing protein [Treponema sp.]|jgi:hypothetical protein|nr:helix-turn-helix domain-containing protein [Treponema sp.]
MPIQRAFKVGIYLAPEQRVFLNKTLGCCRHRVNIKSWYRMVVLKNITISQSPMGKYCASCLAEVSAE